MNYYAVVDLGTNSARLMVAHIASGRVVSDFKTLRMIRIGEGMVEEGRIAPAAISRAVQAIREFQEIAARYDVGRHFFCFGTSAIREASNRGEFLHAVLEGCGVQVDVISGEDEASLGFAGSIEGYGGMFDIGGGSTEVMVGSMQDVWFRHSFLIGTVRCYGLFPGADNANPEAFTAAHHHAAEIFSAIPDPGELSFTGIGGTATAIAAVDLALDTYDAARVQGHVLSLERVQEICLMLESMTRAQRETIAGLEVKRADVAVFGAIIMLEFMKAVGAAHITVSDSDNQEGYLALKLGLI